MKNFILIAAAVQLGACAVPQGGMNMKSSAAGLFGGVSQPAQSGQFVDEAVEVVTAPVGLRVSINGGFVGYSPVKVTARRYWRGAPGIMTLDTVMVEARAAAPDQCDQAGVFGAGSTRLPAPVRFDMTACAAAKPAGKK